MVVLRLCPLFLLHTKDSVCPLFPDDVQGRWSGKCRSVSLDWGGRGRGSLPWVTGMFSLTSVEVSRSSSFASSIRNCSWVSCLCVCVARRRSQQQVKHCPPPPLHSSVGEAIVGEQLVGAVYSTHELVVLLNNHWLPDLLLVGQDKGLHAPLGGLLREILYK